MEGLPNALSLQPQVGGVGMKKAQDSVALLQDLYRLRDQHSCFCHPWVSPKTGWNVQTFCRYQAALPKKLAEKAKVVPIGSL